MHAGSAATRALPTRDPATCPAAGTAAPPAHIPNSGRQRWACNCQQCWRGRRLLLRLTISTPAATVSVFAALCIACSTTSRGWQLPALPLSAQGGAALAEGLGATVRAQGAAGVSATTIPWRLRRWWFHAWHNNHCAVGSSSSSSSCCCRLVVNELSGWDAADCDSTWVHCHSWHCLRKGKAGLGSRWWLLQLLLLLQYCTSRAARHAAGDVYLHPALHLVEDIHTRGAAMNTTTHCSCSSNSSRRGCTDGGRKC